MTKKRTTYDVSPRAGAWKVTRRGASRADSLHKTKEAAMKRGQELAKGQPLGQLVVRKQDGTIQEERTYGADPRRSPG